ENLRYASVYDAIQEARKADDQMDQGEWQHEVKTSDWNQVLSLSVEALTKKSKDLQIAVWLLEALTITAGFKGFSQGLEVIIGFLNNFWENLYPEIEDDDLDFRVGPFEFMNEKIWLPIKNIPVTDSSVSSGYSLVQYEESRQVGSEENAAKLDKTKRQLRDEMIVDGKITADTFNSAEQACSRQYYETLYEEINACVDNFQTLDGIIDEKFGKEAPRLAEVKTSLDECHSLITKIVNKKRELEPDPEPVVSKTSSKQVDENQTLQESTAPNATNTADTSTITTQNIVGQYHVNRLLGSAGMEDAVWKDAVQKLNTTGIKSALEQLLGASCSAQSMREKTNYQLLMARLCLKAGRPELARPVIEELHTTIDELQLVKWESPIWIAEALGTLYQCLKAKGATDDDIKRADELLPRLCTLDITKAIEFSDI
ncbi:MAG: type VI secretion system protein TssA, partial [Desulfobacula sp.]|nr:type VI secretion system protein TssA [Desulfobacula sp.]